MSRLIDAIKVVHAKWIVQDAGITHFMCSSCKAPNYPQRFNYCPDCGAKMDGANDCATVDAVEVVRCKDCKYRDTEQCAMSFRDLTTGKLFSRESDNDFCSKGERK